MRVQLPMFRYGEAGFDADYLRWGFHDAATQVEEAESILRLAPAGRPLRILDLACGIGTHAVRWAQLGHRVTAVDLSATFLAEAQRRASTAGVSVAFQVADIRSLAYEAEFEVATWIEAAFFEDEAVRGAYRALAPGGLFILDVRNPEHPRARSRGGNWRTWREEEGVFHLERHETDEATGLRQSAWITVDPAAGTVIEKTTSGRPISNDERAAVLKAAGFHEVELRTLSGEAFAGGEEPYWLWMVARK